MKIKYCQVCAFLIMLIFCCAFFLIPVKAENEIVVSGPVTDFQGIQSGNLYYEIFSDGTMVITGEGAGCAYRPFGRDYDIMCPWNEYRDQIRVVRFHCSMQHRGTSYIGSGASVNGWFVNCRNLEAVYGLSDNITDLSATFLNCENLRFIESIPANAKTMQYTFYNCRKLQNIPLLPMTLEDDYLTENVDEDLQVSYGLLATFYGCTSLLKAPAIPTNKELYRLVETFKGCKKLTELEIIPENISYLQDSFSDCISLKETMHIEAKEVEFVGNVFQNVASNNPYILFVITQSESVKKSLFHSMSETTRFYIWNEEFSVNCMVQNMQNNNAYGVDKFALNLQYGTDFKNQIIEEYTLFSEEYTAWKTIMPIIPQVEGYQFDGWYLDPAYTNSFSFDTLVNPDSIKLLERELTIYAKMSYIGNSNALTINPNGGLYNGVSTIQIIKEFEEKEYVTQFAYKGFSEIYNTPLSGMYIFTLYGAQGGRCGDHFGGFGGMVRGFSYINAGEKIVVNVGGGGQTSNNTYSAGGYNGGGDSIKAKVDSRYDEDLDEDIDIYQCGGGGGGATDVRMGGNGIENRILIAGGGGGAGYHNVWYARTDRPDYPNIYEDDDGDDYEVYNRTIDGWIGQGGNSAAGGGGGLRGGAHNYEGAEKYGKINSSYGGMNGVDIGKVQLLENYYFVWGKDEYAEYGLNGYATIIYRGKAYTPDNPVREGYIFDGWTVNGDGYWNEETIFMNLQGTELIANWTPIWYNIYFDAGEGSVDNRWLQYCKDSPYGINGNFPIPQNSFGEFLGWYNSKGERVTERTIANSTGDIILYAKYQQMGCLAMFDSDNGESYQPVFVWFGSEYGTLPIPQKVGFEFQGWKNDYGMVDEHSIVELRYDHWLRAIWKSLEPPELDGFARDEEWRNKPFELNLNIKDKSKVGLYRVAMFYDYEDVSGYVYYDVEFAEKECFEWNLQFTLGNIETKEFEGVSNWHIMVMDYAGNISEESFVLKLDFTPPEIFGNGNIEAIQYCENELIRQKARDLISGICYFEILPGSMQRGERDNEYINICTEEPFVIEYSTDRKALKNEGGYILTAFDNAGNKTIKVIFTKNSLNNSYHRVVPKENYDMFKK